MRPCCRTSAALDAARTSSPWWRAGLDEAIGRAPSGLPRRSAYDAVRLAAQHARCHPRVVEPRDPGQHDRDEERPPRDAGVPRAGRLRARARVAATVCAHVFSLPRSRAPMTTPRSIAARRSPETSDLARDDRRDHPRGGDTLRDEHHERGEDEHLVRDRVEQRAERRRLVPASGEPPSTWSVAIATTNTPVAQYGGSGSPRRRGRSRREPRAPARASTGRAGSRFGENTRRMPPFSKVLVANRGEIAIRVFRTLRELGIGCVAVYSEADRGRAHVRVADEAYLVGPGPAAESYLRGDVLVETALRAGAEAIHPGYGFLAENAAFARMVEEAGLTLDRAAGGRDRADGHEDRGAPGDARRRSADRPRLRRSAANRERGRRPRRRGRIPAHHQGRGGRRREGMEIVRRPDEAERAFEAATRQGEKYFADPAVYVERYLEDPAARRGAGPRRRARQRDPPRRAGLHDPAPPPEARRGDALARRRRRARFPDRADRGRRRPRRGLPLGGDGRGSPDTEGDYFFMEMNTRIQVEHTVTEAVTGLDLVREQVLDRRRRAALARAGGRRSSRPRNRVPDQRGRRDQGLPSCPRQDHGVSRARGAGRPGRLGRRGGDEVSGLYDPMIAKLIVHDVDRDRAIARMQRALAEFRIEGRRRCSAFTARCSSTRASARARRARASSSPRSWRHARRSWRISSLMRQQA